METLTLTLELLKRIPRNSKISAPELHRQLAEAGLVRELRTIQRQLEMLCENFDIARDDRNKPYGYSWKEKAKGLSLTTLNEQESVLLTLAEQHLRNLLPVSLMKSMDGFFAEAKARLGPHTNATQAREWLQKVRVVSTTQPLLPPKLKAGVFEAVSSALYANHWLDVDYTNAQGQRKIKRVMPLGLAQQGPRLFLISRFEGFDNERALALHRIVKANDSGLGFDRPVGFDLGKYDEDGRFGFGDGRKIQLVFRIAKGAGLHLLETPLSTDQVARELANDYEITATVIESERLRWWLRGFGAEVHVVAPKGLLD